MAEIYTNRLQIESNGNTYILDAAAGGGSGGGAPINVPLGAIIGFMTDAAPLGFLECDGTVYNISQYPKLFQAIGNKFGGDGETTFAVPDLRGEFLRGSGENSHDGQGSGGEVGEHQDGTGHVNQWGYKNGSNYYTGAYIANEAWNASQNADSSYQTVPIYYRNTASRVTGESTGFFTSRPTNTSVLYCIKAIPVAGDIGIELTEEHLTGETYNGKPVYEKLLIFNNITGNETYVSVGAPIKEYLYVGGALDDLDYPGSGKTIPDARHDEVGYQCGVSCFTNSWVSNPNSLRIELGGKISGRKHTARITIKYTKTTD